MGGTIRHWAFAAFLAGALFPATCLGADDQQCGLKRGPSLDMILQHTGEISVPVGIQGRTFLLTVDTGDVISVLTESAVSALHKDSLVAMGVRMLTLGQISMNHYVNVEDVRIGHMHADKFLFMVAPDRLLDDTDGLLGADIMSNYDIDLDFAHAKLNIFSQDHCPGDVVYWTQQGFGVVPMRLDADGHIKVRVTIDGKTLDAIVDTGADKTTMSLATAKSLFGLDEKSPGITKRANIYINGGPALPTYHYPFASLAFADISVQHPDIDILDESNDMEAPLLIGINVLRQLHVYIAYREQMLYVTPAEAQ